MTPGPKYQMEVKTLIIIFMLEMNILILEFVFKFKGKKALIKPQWTSQRSVYMYICPNLNRMKCTTKHFINKLARIVTDQLSAIGLSKTDFICIMEFI